MTARLELLMARKRKGFTQDYVASRIEVSRVMYNRYERGLAEIPPDKARKLCELLEMDFNSVYA